MGGSEANVARPSREEILADRVALVGDPENEDGKPCGYAVELIVQEHGGEHWASSIPRNFKTSLYSNDIDELMSRVHKLAGEIPDIAQRISSRLPPHRIEIHRPRS